MSDPIVIFRGTSGLNTVADPLRIFNKDGISDLQVAINIDIDQSLRPSRRSGVTKIQSGSYHSLFCDEKNCFVIKEDSLYKVSADNSLLGIRSDLTLNAQMDFAQFGEYTYYTNSYEIGYIFNDVSYPWVKGNYIGPTTTKIFSGPVIGNHLSVFNGRMLIAYENALYWSELYNFGLYNLSESFVQFDTKIIMIKSVDSGCFISTEKEVYFLKGKNPAFWEPKKVTNFPALEWSVATSYVDGYDIGLQPGLCCVWASPEGVIIGISDGTVLNLNKDKVIYPESAKSGFSCLMGYSFIHGMQ